MRFAAGIEYCGSRYLGWQRQENGPTIQEQVENSLSIIADHPIHVHCSGRTDSGVHALQQVIHFDTSAERRPHAWTLGGNVNLPSDIVIIWTQLVPPEFHARFSATGRTYRYIVLYRRSRAALLRDQVAWECRDLDSERMSVAAADLIGEHDFSAFRAQGCQAKTAVRNVRRLDVSRCGDFVVLEIESNAFLQHMVRNMAGVLMAIGTGDRPVEWARRVRESRDRTQGGVTAAAEGLYFVSAIYEDKFRIRAPSSNIPIRLFAGLAGTSSPANTQRPRAKADGQA
ncbi:MAG: tRNA pseudouridine(38-40) synthase TruA [Gammaproteobacteria bacterium]